MAAPCIANGARRNAVVYSAAFAADLREGLAAAAAASGGHSSVASAAASTPSIVPTSSTIVAPRLAQRRNALEHTWNGSELRRALSLPSPTPSPLPQPTSCASPVPLQPSASGGPVQVQQHQQIRMWPRGVSPRCSPAPTPTRSPAPFTEPCSPAPAATTVETSNRINRIIVPTVLGGVPQRVGDAEHGLCITLEACTPAEAAEDQLNQLPFELHEASGGTDSVGASASGDFLYPLPVLRSPSPRAAMLLDFFRSPSPSPRSSSALPSPSPSPPPMSVSRRSNNGRRRTAVIAHSDFRDVIPEEWIRSGDELDREDPGHEVAASSSSSSAVRHDGTVVSPRIRTRRPSQPAVPSHRGNLSVLLQDGSTDHAPAQETPSTVLGGGLDANHTPFWSPSSTLSASSGQADQTTTPTSSSSLRGALNSPMSGSIDGAGGGRSRRTRRGSVPSIAHRRGSRVLLDWAALSRPTVGFA